VNGRRFARIANGCDSCYVRGFSAISADRLPHRAITSWNGRRRVRLAQILENERPDAIILDLMLPDIDGYEVLRRLRAARTLVA